MLNKNFPTINSIDRKVETELKNNNLNLPSFFNSVNLFCDGCSSDDISESIDGYVCRNCGLIIDVPIFRHNSPYNQDSVQVYSNELKKTTKLGTNLERISNSRSYEFQRMSKMQNISNEYENFVLHLANSEFNRILTALHLPNSLKNDCISIFRIVWKNLKKGTKGRSAEKLAPVILFMVLKVKTINFDVSSFMNILNVNKNDFKEILIETVRYYPAYAKRERKPLILKKVNEICEFFNFDKDFIILANVILQKFWPHIKNTKDDVIAGVISALVVIVKEIRSVSISRICDKIGIKMSTINYQVKNHIFGKKKNAGFRSLINSSNLIRDIVKCFVFNALIVEPETTQDISDENEIKESNNSEIIFLNLNNNKEHHFKISLEDFRDIFPYSFHSEPLKLTVNRYPLNFSTDYENNADKNKINILKLKSREKFPYRKKSGKGPPFTNY